MFSQATDTTRHTGDLVFWTGSWRTKTTIQEVAGNVTKSKQLCKDSILRCNNFKEKTYCLMISSDFYSLKALLMLSVSYLNKDE